MSTKNINKKLERLINKAWFTDDKEKATQLAHQILDISPENTDALLILVDNLDDDTDEGNSQREILLDRALKSIESEENDYPEEVKASFYVSVHFRLAYTLFAQEKFTETLASCQNALKLLNADNDNDNDDIMDFNIESELKALQYRTLIELRNWRKILDMTMKDETHSLAWAYSKLIAVWMTAPSGKKSEVCASLFWDAVAISPNVPFYILAYYDEPDDDDSEDFVFSVLFCDILDASHEFANWFTRGTALFGLLTNRFEDRERAFIIEILKDLGGYEEYEKMNAIVLEADDASVIETLMAHKCLRK
ncbi:MAG: hypothetical protein IJL10_01545 [Synergistaceae bacterium]|nr:hypothetical protein [Synergistaceae bacterium]